MALVTGRLSREAEKEKLPSATVTGSLMDQTLVEDGSLATGHARPILLDKSTVPRGQMLPVCHDQFLSASFQITEDSRINKRSEFRALSSTSLTLSAFSRTSPEMGPVRSSTQVPWDLTPGQIDPDAVTLDETFALNRAFRSVDSLMGNESHLTDQRGRRVEDWTNQKCMPLSEDQTSTECSSDLKPGDRINLQSEVACRSFAPDAVGDLDAVSPQWLDLFLDGRGNLCFPDANLEESAFSLETGSF